MVVNERDIDADKIMISKNKMSTKKINCPCNLSEKETYCKYAKSDSDISLTPVYVTRGIFLFALSCFYLLVCLFVHA